MVPSSAPEFSSVGTCAHLEQSSFTRPLQLLNASSPILVTELGIVIEASEGQLYNILSSMIFTELGIVIEARGRQSQNALYPMLVTEFGIEIEARDLKL